MIKKIIPLAALFVSGYATAQVGVGVKKPADATMLDVTATDKGVLLPRVNLSSDTDTTTIKGQLVESLLVYNIGSNNLKAGFYYWFENKWTPLMSGATFIDTTNRSFTISDDQEKLVITDSQNNKVELAVKEFAKNSVFIKNLTENQEFIKQLGDNIEFVKQITNNEEFVNNIINKLEGDFGNVGYDKDKNQFFYLKDGKVVYIDWADLDTVNVKFAFDNKKEQLVITDSKGGVVSISTDELGETIAKNSVFVKNLTENQEFITKLGENIEFVKQITNNEEFVNNIINKLEGDFGNVGYDKDKNQFFYLKDGNVVYIDWSDLDTVNVKFAFDDKKEQLVITDSKGGVVSISTDELGETIAKNSVFVKNLTENQEFITKLGENIEFVKQITNNQEFIDNIINKLEGDFGNVGYDKDKNQFFYLKDGNVVYIDWSDLDTVNVKFAFDDKKEQLVITDSKGGVVSISTDELGETIAKNSVFVKNLTENQEFIKQLGDNIEFVKQITNNQEFIDNIINKLEGDFGNVGYDKDKNQFFYLKDGNVVYIDWSDLDTVNVKFAFDDKKEQLIITDSKGGVVSISTDELGETIAKNSVFVKNLTENQEFIKQLGDNIEFVKNITNNEEFVNNIINKLEGDFGNVGYDKDKNQFFYLKDGNVVYIDWSDLDTVNVKFAFDDKKEQLVITDSKGGVVSISTDELGETIAKNSVFVKNLTENQEFIKQLGDNIEFVKQITNNEEFVNNIINKLEGDFGNVGYDKDKNQFFYLKDGNVVYIDWSDLDTVNVKFAFDDKKEQLVITDSKGGVVSISTDELGETIAKNSVFVKNLTENQEFITKLGENIEFVKQITNNQEFIDNIINKLEGDFGNVGYDKDKNQFFYLKDGNVVYIDWSDLDTVNVKFAFDDKKEQLVITDSKGGVVSISTDELGETIAKNSVFVKNLTENQEFIKQLGDNIEFVKQITNNEEFVNNIINKLEGDFGNVGYDKDKNQFFYLKDGNVVYIDWSDLDTVNVKFAFDDKKEQLVITDSKGGVVSISTDELGETIAKNSVFVKNLTENHEFIKQLGDNIEFVKQITNNEEFVNNIINKLEGDFGNVGYDKDKNQFFYLKDGKVVYIDWADLDTVNVKFAFDDKKEQLVITDSKGGVVSISTDELGETIAKNSVFVKNLTENQEFIKQLGDNIEFVKQITNNEEFVNNIINKLEGDFGNVGYDKDKNQFFYLKDGKVVYIDWADLDTVNVNFAFDDKKEQLVITDSKGGVVSISTDELGETIAKNSVFVKNLTENQEFIKQLGDNIEFVKQITNNEEFVNNIINKLEGDFGNVGYDKDKNQFFYLKEGKVVYIDWADLDTVNVKFAFDDKKEQLVITDSKGGVVSISTDELGETIAKNSVFVKNLTENQEFIKQLGDNIEFVKQITNNEEFVNNIINKLEGDFGNVGYDKDKNQFFYLKDGNVVYIDWSDLDTVNVKFAFDDKKEQLVITDSKGGVVSISTDELGETIAKNSVFVKNLTENHEFIKQLGDNIEFVKQITNNEEFVNNIINKLEGDFGNVGYDKDKNQFFYLKDGKVVYIDWADLDTVNVKFAFDDKKEQLVITDSKGGVVSISTDELGETIAKNSVFVKNLTENQEFIKQLGDNIEFVKQITNNEEFVNNIINKLEGDFGNVGYDKDKNQFFYLKDGKVVYIDWADLDTVNVNFAFDDKKEQLVITDSKGGVVSISTDELGETIAKNSVFVKNLTENQEFIKQLGDNIEFVKQITNNEEFVNNIINKLEGDFGNVGYDKDKNQFFYLKEGKVVYIDWADLDTVNVKFAFDDKKEQLVITDSKGGVVSISTDELGETIAKNSVFVKNLTENQEFITKLGENIEFVKNITNNQEFIDNIINKLEGDFGNVGYDKDKNQFFYLKDGNVVYIDWSDLDTVNVKFAFDDKKEQLVITDSKGGVVSISTDELGETIAKNSVFVKNLTENQEFIKQLGDNIEFVKQITNNEEFVNNIINKLEGDFGNVGYDKDKNQFFYLKDGNVVYIDWSDLDTVNVKFAFDDKKEQLVITDSKGGVVSISTDELGETIAKNSVFVKNLTENQEFITKLGENIEFVKQITNNQEFIDNIINKLEGDFGNVGYDKDKNQFFYLKDGNVVYIDWSDLDTVNVKFAFDNKKEQLVITDSKGGVVSISTDELGETIAKNSVFVKNLTENQEFITKLGENIEFVKNITNNQEFIDNIINKLEGDFGNVGYDKDKNQFFYLKDGNVVYIDWSDLDTVNVKFAFDDKKEQLVITDSKGGVVSISTDELGETIAKNSVFVKNLTENQEFIKQLGDNIEFVKQITNNQEFIDNIINKLEGDFGNVGYDKDKNQFFYLKDGNVVYIDWSDLDTVNVKFAFDDKKEQLIITDSKGGVVSISTDELGETIAKNSVFVKNLTENQEFIKQLGDNIEFVKNITNNEEFVNNIINKLEGKYGNVVYNETTKEFNYIKEDGTQGVIDWSVAVKSVETETTLIAEKDINGKLTGKYIYTNEKDVVTEIDVVQSVIDNSKTIFEDNSVIKEIIKEIEKEAGPGTVTVVEKDGDFIFNWKDADGKEHTTTIKELVSKFETLTSLTGVNTDDKALLVYADENKKVHELDLTVLLKNSNVFNEFLKQFISSVSIEETITTIVAEQKDGKNTGNYDYYNEERALAGHKPFRISVVSDVENNFQEIINNKNVQEILNKYITDNVEGNVTYEGGKFYVTIKEGDTYKTEEIKIGDIVKLSETETTLIAEKDINGKLTGKYTYTNEKDIVTEIDVVKSVIDNSKTIFEDNSVIKEIIKEIEKEAGPGTVTVVEKDGDFIFKWKDADGKEHTTTIKELVSKFETLTSLTGVNTDDKALLVYADEDKKIHELDLTVLLKNSNVFNEFLKQFISSVSIEETITTIVAEQKDGKNTGNYDYYNEERALAGHKPFRISVVSDVENNFQEIINNKNVQEILNKYITDNVEGNVTYEGGKFYVTIKEGDTYKTEEIKIGDIVKLSETETTLIAEKDINGKLTGKYTYTNEKDVVTEIDVVQSVIDNSKTIFEDNSVIKEIIKEIEKEAGPGTVTVVEKDGDFIFKWKAADGKEYTKGLIDLIKENSTVASLVLKNTGNANDVKAGFVFKAGKNNAEVVFAETLTELEKGYRTHDVNGEKVDLKEYYFIDETRERDDVIIKVSETIIEEFDKLVKFDNVKNTLNQFISSAAGDVSVTKVGEDIVIKDNKSNVEVNLTNEIRAKETKTTLEAVKYDMYVYMVEVNGEFLEEHTDVKREGETALREYQATKYVYTNELGQEKEIKGSELFGATGGGSTSLETLTTLSFDAKYGEDLNTGQVGRPALVYKDEEKNVSPIFIDQIFQSSETLTSLEANADTRELIYIDENKNKHFISYDVLVQQPWFTGQDQQATKNNQDIYTMGWVGIGYKEKSAAPNEKLRVNGSITATNSYYADYVFESYFDGYSSLKYDYKFNDLNSVDSYIKSNRHLPGITPISDLEKTETGYSFNVSELSIQLLEKTEELFLHVIDQQKELNAKDSEIKDLKKDVNDLTKRLEALEALLK